MSFIKAAKVGIWKNNKYEKQLWFLAESKSGGFRLCPLH